VRCYGQGGFCFVTNDFLVEAEQSSVHDETLIQATKEINAIFERVEKGNHDPKRRLSVLLTPIGHFLAWTTSGEVTDDEARSTMPPLDYSSSAEEITKAFRLKHAASPAAPA
jgi:hypothetical protein